MPRRDVAKAQGSIEGGRRRARRSSTLLGFALSLTFALASAGPALGAGDANTPACGNEGLAGFSAALPDCRAFELVSPAYKQGYQMTFEGSAPDGSRVIGGSLGALVGAKGAPQTRNDLGDVYEMARSADGWQTTPLSPENPAYRDALTYWAPSTSAAETLFSMPSAPAGQDDFYVVKDAGASVSDLGPVTPPADGPTQEPAPPGGPSVSFVKVVGVTPSLSHVLFAVKSPFGWDGDPTAGEDVYEYPASGGAEGPSMIAVEGGRGSTALIGECGVTVGGPGGTTSYNALSSDGNVAFFTPVPEDEGACGLKQPARAQLYARVDQSSTVRLSAPQCTPEFCEATPESDAVFSGASASGDRAFFLSTQRLSAQATEDTTSSDSASIRGGSGCELAEGTGCNLYEYDLETGRLTAISAGTGAPHVQGVVRVSPDGSRVYFVATSRLTGAANSEGAHAQEGQDNLYVYEHVGGGEATAIHFVATVSPEDEGLWGGSGAEDSARPASTTPNGEFLVFESRGDLTSDDTSSGVTQVFEYQAGEVDTLKRISIGENGFNDDGNTSADSAVIPTAEYIERRWYYPQPIVVSNNGQMVVFESEDPLTEGAGSGEPGRLNVYEYDSGHVYYIYGATGDGAPLYGTDESGDDIFFKAQAGLVPEDTDTQTDIYDARVDGGTRPVNALACSAGSCQAESGPPVEFGFPGSMAVSGSENVLAPAPVKTSKARAAKPLTKAQKLRKALAACAKERKSRRAKCRRLAKRRYGGKAK